jgi:hypothetical protein
LTQGLAQQVTNGGEQWNVAPALLRPAVVATDAVEIIEAPLHEDRP